MGSGRVEVEVEVTAEFCILQSSCRSTLDALLDIKIAHRQFWVRCR